MSNVVSTADRLGYAAVLGYLITCISLSRAMVAARTFHELAPSVVVGEKLTQEATLYERVFENAHWAAASQQ
jgi:fumarate reductase subunit C